MDSRSRESQSWRCQSEFIQVNLYDDSGYSAMKRVLERGDDAASVKPLVTIVVNHPVSTLKINSDGLFWI